MRYFLKIKNPIAVMLEQITGKRIDGAEEIREAKEGITHEQIGQTIAQLMHDGIADVQLLLAVSASECADSEVARSMSVQARAEIDAASEKEWLRLGHQEPLSSATSSRHVHEMHNVSGNICDIFNEARLSAEQSELDTRLDEAKPAADQLLTKVSQGTFIPGPRTRQ